MPLVAGAASGPVRITNIVAGHRRDVDHAPQLELSAPPQESRKTGTVNFPEFVRDQGTDVIRGPTSLRTVGYAAAPAVGATSLGGEAPDGSAPPAQPAGDTGGRGRPHQDGPARAAPLAVTGCCLSCWPPGSACAFTSWPTGGPFLHRLLQVPEGQRGPRSGRLQPVAEAGPVGGNLATVAAVQHLLGLAMAVILYLTLSRRTLPAGPPPWPPLRCCLTPPAASVI